MNGLLYFDHGEVVTRIPWVALIRGVVLIRDLLFLGNFEVVTRIPFVALIRGVV